MTVRTLPESILLALAASEPLTSAEIAAATGGHERTVRATLAHMADTGAIRRIAGATGTLPRYRYALPLADAKGGPVSFFPWARAGEYLAHRHTGTVADDVRRLRAE